MNAGMSWTSKSELHSGPSSGWAINRITYGICGWLRVCQLPFSSMQKRCLNMVRVAKVLIRAQASLIYPWQLYQVTVWAPLMNQMWSASSVQCGDYGGKDFCTHEFSKCLNPELFFISIHDLMIINNVMKVVIHLGQCWTAITLCLYSFNFPTFHLLHYSFIYSEHVFC